MFLASIWTLRCIAVQGSRSRSLAFEASLPHGVLLNSIERDPEAKPGGCRHGDRPITVQAHRRVNQVFMIIAVAGRDISGQPEVGEGGQRKIRSAANARLQ